MTAEPIDDGGPAFPVTGHMVDASGAYCGDIVYAKGLSLRDYFASQAMQGLVAVPVEQWAELKWARDLTVGEAMAIQAYKIADAMLLVRRA